MKRFVLMLVVGAMCVGAWAQGYEGSSTWEDSLRVRLDSLLQHPMFETTQVGIEVFDLTADSAIYKHGERQLLRPASTMKVLSAVATLDELGSSYQFRTRMYRSGKITGRTLRGNIYCRGGMDPCFNSDDLGAFVETLSKMGIDTIRGFIVADYSMKDDKRLGEGWCWDDDNPVLSPLLVNKKDNFLRRFLNRLRDERIVLLGDTLRGLVPRDAEVICTRSHSIDQVLMPMMKKSDNLFAESMFYQLAAATGTRTASAKDGASQVNRVIRKMGLSPDDYRIADGSGLSLYNYVTAELEVAFLRYAYRQQDIYNNLLPALPVAGVDGTLAKRMTQGPAHRNVQAKTGTVTGISSLAGYCTARNGHRLCFSIINTGLRKASIGRQIQDRICELLTE